MRAITATIAKNRRQITKKKKKNITKFKITVLLLY